MSKKDDVIHVATLAKPFQQVATELAIPLGIADLQEQLSVLEPNKRVPRRFSLERQGEIGGGHLPVAALGVEPARPQSSSLATAWVGRGSRSGRRCFRDRW